MTLAFRIILAALLLSAFSGCETIPEGVLRASAGSIDGLDPAKCRLIIEVIPFSSTNVYEMGLHNYEYKSIKVVNSDTREYEVYELKKAEKTNNAVIDLPPGNYTLWSVYVQDVHPKQYTRGVLFDNLVEVKLKQKINLSPDLVGRVFAFAVDPLAINDFTVKRYDIR